jgi:hypothetical protein
MHESCRLNRMGWRAGIFGGINPHGTGYATNHEQLRYVKGTNRYPLTVLVAGKPQRVGDKRGPYVAGSIALRKVTARLTRSQVKQR